jgi:hypothetical protein
VKLFKSIFGDVFLMWLWVYCEQAIVGLKIITYKNKKKNAISNGITDGIAFPSAILSGFANFSF